MAAAVGLSIGANPGGGVEAARLVWCLASFYIVYLLGSPAGWLLYQLRPVAAAGKIDGNASTAPEGESPFDGRADAHEPSPPCDPCDGEASRADSPLGAHGSVVRASRVA